MALDGQLALACNGCGAFLVRLGTIPNEVGVVERSVRMQLGFIEVNGLGW